MLRRVSRSRIPASLAVDVSNGTALLAAVNDGTVGSIRLVANVTTPFAWTQAGVFITRDLVIESDTDVCGGGGCHVFGHDSRDFVRVANGATVTMRKMILDDHGDTVAPFSYEGGAVRVVNGTLVAEDCQFTDNVGLYGGAVDVGVNGFARFERCVFVGNVAASQNADDKYKAGGAVRFDGGDGVITDCTFRANHGAEGAAVHVANGATVRFERTVFVDNEDPSSTGGGANHLRADDAGTRASLFDCAFTTTNAAKRGGEMYADVGSTIELSPYTSALEAQSSGPGSFVRWSEPPPPSPPRRRRRRRPRAAAAAPAPADPEPAPRARTRPRHRRRPHRRRPRLGSRTRSYSTSPTLRLRSSARVWVSWSSSSPLRASSSASSRANACGRSGRGSER